VNRPAPKFRSRREKRRSLPRRRLVILGGIVVALLAALGIVLGLVLSGDDDGGTDLPAAVGEGTVYPKSTQGVAGGPEPLLSGPVAKYIVQLDDVRGAEVHVTETFNLSATQFAGNGSFRSVSEGEELAEQWGYLEGYQGSIQPRGRVAEVIKGAYFIRTEAYLFRTIEGAALAYAHIEQVHMRQAGSTPVAILALGNQSSAFNVLEGTFGDQPASYNRFIFRRGNLVAIVQATGVKDRTTPDTARDLAVVVDAKALGVLPAPTPTSPPRSQTPQLPAGTPTR
jgi:hypothetical protein